MKRIAVIMLVLFVFGCAQETKPSGWCYLTAGLYLIVGDVHIAEQWADAERSNWPEPAGYTTDVYYYYNNDESRCLDIGYTIKDANTWFDKGALVVIIYESRPGIYHAEPYTFKYSRDVVEVITTFDCGKIY